MTTSVKERSVIKGERFINVAQTENNICKQSESSCVGCSRSALLHTLMRQHFIFGTHKTQHDKIIKVFFPGDQMFTATRRAIPISNTH